MDENELIEFIEKLQNWHKQNVEQLSQVLENKEAEFFEVNGEKYSVDSEFVQGYKGGVNLALNFFGKLPFTMEVKDAE